MAISSTIDLCGFDIMSFNVRGIQNERKRR
jgi:hypothetical protein